MSEVKYDQYGRYVDDDGHIELPDDATLAERIADILRMDDRWQWKETINISGYTIFELLREAHKVLSNDQTYPPCEEKTQDRIQDEPWYYQYQSVAEVVCAGDGDVSFEFYDNAFELAFTACKDHAYLKDISDERLRVWIMSIIFHFDSAIEIYKMNKDFHRLNMLRPDHYAELSTELQWRIDKKLGLLDWNGNE